MKILGGALKGRNFYMPAGCRPTQDVVRKALFDILGQDMTGLTVLDVFAGSGAVGLEALSRGAKFCTFIEKEPKHARITEENADLLGLEAYEVLLQDGFAGIKSLAGQKRHFDIVFVDPPYGRQLAKKALKTLNGYDIVHAHSTVIIQHDKAEALTESEGSLRLFRTKKQGSTLLSFYKKGTPSDGK